METIDRIADPIKSACLRMGISKATAYREIAAGRLTSIKARRRTLIARAEQERWLASLPDSTSSYRRP